VLVAGTAVLAIVWFVRKAFAGKDPARRRALRGRVFGAWSRWCLRCVGVHLRIVGEPPAAPCLLVSNHLGYVDILVIASQVNGVFLSSDDVARIPLIGLMAREFGTLFVDRSQKREIPRVTRALADALESGEIVVLFPEGTNSRGDRVHRFHASFLAVAAERGAPVAWVTLRHATGPSDPPASSSVCWVDDPGLRHALGFLSLERIESTLVFGAGTVTGNDRKKLARELEARVAAAFEPMT
jgi:1-acyl-sn-glycerol-3-phosphate acyltransferase